MSGEHSRSNYFIKKDLQGRYVFSYFLFVLLGSLIFAGILALFSADTMTIVYNNHDLELGRTPAILLSKLLSAHWAFVVLGGILVVIGAVFLTHRFAGPLYRFENTLDEMTKGNIGIKTYLRKTDEGKELAEKINQFNTMLAAKIRDMSRLAEELDASQAKLAKIIERPQENREAASLELDQAQLLTGRIRELLTSFIVKSP